MHGSCVQTLVRENCRKEEQREKIINILNQIRFFTQ